MRVAHLLRKYDPSEWGGTESAILRLTSDLSRQGVESVVYAPKLRHPAGDSDPFLAAGCVVRRYRAYVPILGIQAEHKRQMVSVGGNMVSLDLIASMLSDSTVDVVHSHVQGRLGAIARVVARCRGLPFVLSIHGGAYDLPPEVRKALRKPYEGGWDWGRPLGMVLRARNLMNQADAIIVLNPREAELIKEHHPGRRVQVETHGVPTALFSRDCRAAARMAFPELEGRSVLLVLGRIDKVKNQGWLVAEAAELARRHPKIVLAFVGAFTDQEYGDALLARIAREGLQNHVKMLGALPSGDPRLIGLLQEARAVVLPSLSETFGLVILEAWAAGTPVVSSRTSGALALVADGVDGLLFDLERPATFHVAVSRLISQPEVALGWARAGRAKVVANFDTSLRAEKMKQLYEELVEQKNALRNTKG